VLADGSVGDVRVTRSLDPEIDREAIATLKKWTFKPGMKDGQPVAVQVEVEMTFSMK
jgi:periplasmic protein TonB